MQTFGAYSLAITTANNISTYAAGGIGSTAARFSGKYAYGTSGYGTLARVLAIVSLVSALIAAIGLWLGAVPLSYLLHKESLTGLLRWAAVSASGIILLECARGFFVGQRRLAALVLLSLLVGVGMLVLVPAAAHARNPVRMIVTQGLITTTAVVACLLLAKPLGLIGPNVGERLAVGPMLREVWSFGFVQLAGLVGVNLAGWWLMTLVARADTTLVQMGFFAIASQLRNIVALVPSLLTEGSYASMADPDGRSRTPTAPYGFVRVCLNCGFACFSRYRNCAGSVDAEGNVWAGVWCCGVGDVAWTCSCDHAHGKCSCSGSIVHCFDQGGGVHQHYLGHSLWQERLRFSCCVGGSAAEAMAIYLAAHVLSAGLVMAVLAKKDKLPPDTLMVCLLGRCEQS